MTRRSLHDTALETVDAAAELLGLEPWLAEVVRRPERSVEVEVPFKRTDGSVDVVLGWRVQHSTARGPAKGGTRFHPQVTPAEVKGLATLMSVKTALLSLPLGGGKGGVACDPKELEVSELEGITRSYVRGIAPMVGSTVDVPAPDVNTNEQTMDWFADEYARITGSVDPGVVTGKSIAAGGSLGRDTATAAGCRTVVQQAAKKLGLPADAGVVVQGFGNAGAHLAHMLAEDGYRVVGVSDSRGGVHDPSGLDVPAVAAAKAAHGSVTAYTEADRCSDAELLALPCDILVPAALEEAIDERTAAHVRASLIVEAANGPCTTEAALVLAANGVTVVPDVLASAGGVTVSYFEWAQNQANERWSEQHVSRELERRMVAAFDDLWAYSTQEHLPLRLAAAALGVQRVAEATRVQLGAGAAA